MSISIEIKGIVKKVKETEIIGDFQKRSIWITETEGNYPQTFQIEATKDKCGLLDVFSAGDTVVAKCNLNGRYWQKNDKDGVMNTIQLWTINKQNGGEHIDIVRAKNQQEYKDSFATTPAENNNDLPF